MQRSARPTIALFMTAIYLVVVLAPLAPTVLHSPALAHALTGECSGDCGICGCAPERSAARACCCWQKKKRSEERRTITARGGSCCRLAPVPPPVTANSCCPGKKTAPPPVTAGGCCSKQTALASDAGENHQHEPGGETVITATPCGSGKLIGLAASEKIQHMPFTFSNRPPCQLHTPYSPLLSERLTSLPGEPPDPPPKLTVLT